MSYNVVNPKNKSDSGQDAFVRIRVASGRDLTAKDSNGKSDPFVKCKLNMEKVHKTKVISKTLNPIWNNEAFDIRITPNQYKITATMNDAIELRFEIFDKDIIGEDKMGEVQFMLDREILDQSPVGKEQIKEFQVALGSGFLSIGITVLQRGYEHRSDNKQLSLLLKGDAENNATYVNYVSRAQAAGSTFGWLQVAVPMGYSEDAPSGTIVGEIFRASLPSLFSKEGTKDIWVETRPSLDIRAEETTYARMMQTLEQSTDQQFKEWTERNSMFPREPFAIAHMSTAASKVIQPLQPSNVKMMGEWPVRFFSTGNLVLDNGEFYWRITTRYVAHPCFATEAIIVSFQSWHPSKLKVTLDAPPPAASETIPEFDSLVPEHVSQRDENGLMANVLRLMCWGYKENNTN